MTHHDYQKNGGKIEPLTVERVLDLWSRTYNREGKPDWSHIYPYYHEAIVFQDFHPKDRGN